MNTPYLIQRANFCDSDKKGINGILRFDYMGSAEFEWRALPKSLKRIRADIDRYTVDRMIINGNPVNIFCKEDEVSDVIGFLSFASLEKYPHMKAQPMFYQYVNDEDNRVDHWWDIENDFMFWRDKRGFNDKFLEAMGV